MLKLGPWQADQANYAIIASTGKVELEPLLAKLLWFFLQHPQQIISRQQLSDAVWQQGFVDDNAINRAISDLRKALQHPLLPDSPLKTHHRKGYSLQWDVELQQQFERAHPADHDRQTSAQPYIAQTAAGAARVPAAVAPMSAATPAGGVAQFQLWQRALLGAGLCILLGLLLSAFWPQPASPQSPVAGKLLSAAQNPPVSVQRITRQQGVMTSPLLSTDKSLLAYNQASQMQGAGSQGAVTVRRFDPARSDTEEVNLLLAGELLAVQSWQHGRPVLLVKAINPQKKTCHYRTYDFSAFPAYRQTSLTAQCAPAILLKSLLSPDGQLLYSGVVAAAGPQQGQQQIVQEDLGSGQTRVLAIGQGNLVGISAMNLSPDNQQLAYYAFENVRSGQLYLLQLESGETRRLSSSNQTGMLSQLAFDSDGAYVYAANGLQLLRIATDGSGVQSQPLPAELGAAELTLLDAQRGIVSQLMRPQSGKVQLRTAILSAGGSAKTGVSWFNADSGSVLLPTPAPGQPQRVAYLSDRSGQWQLWLREQDKDRQLTELPVVHSQFNRIEWSADGSQLVFGTSQHVWWYQLASQQLTQLHKDQQIGFPTFDPSGNSLVVQRAVGKQLQLWRIQLPSGQLQRLGLQEGMMPQFEQGQLYYSRNNQLWRFVDGAKADQLIYQHRSNLPWLYQLRHGMVSWVSLEDQRLWQLPLDAPAAADRQPEPLSLPAGGLDAQMLPMLLSSDPNDPTRRYLLVLVRPDLQLYQLQWPAFGSVQK